MHFLHSTFAGAQGESDWSQAYLRSGEELLVGVVINVNTPGQNAVHLGKSILDSCIASMHEQMSRDQFLTLFAMWEKTGINICAVFVQAERMLVYSQGSTQVSLIRNGRSETIIEGGFSGAYLEGEIKTGDYFVCATKDYVTSFGLPDPSVLPEEWAESLSAKFSQTPGEKICALFLSARQEQKTIPTLPIKLADDHTRARLQQLAYKMSHKVRRYGKPILLLVTMVLVVLTISAYLTNRKNYNLEKSLSPYADKLTYVKSLSFDKKMEQLEKLNELSQDLRVAISTTKEARLSRKLQDLASQASDLYAKLANEKRVGKLRVFYDFRLVAADFVASSVAYDVPGRLAVFLDSARGRVLSLSLEKKEPLQLTVSEKLARPISITVENRKAYVMGDEGVMQLSLPLDVMGSVVLLPDGVWQNPKLIGSFGQNAYVFDSGVRNVLKYDLTDQNATPSGWLRNKEGFDFESIVSMQIDGNLWFGTNAGKINLYSQGNPQKFSIKDLLTPPTSPVYLYTTKESSKLYVLEPHAGRILILNKDGTHQGTILSDDLLTATGLVVDEVSSKIYVLSGSLVYEVEI